MDLSLLGKSKLPHSRFTVYCLLPTAYCLLLTVYCLLLPGSASAAIQWSAAVVTGYYTPRLDELNYILKNAFVELGPRNTEAKPFSYPVIYQGISPEMPKMRPHEPKMGLQIQADLNPRYAMVFGMSTANLDSTKRDIRNFFVGFNIPAVRETRFSLLLNQFWFGAKRYWTFEKAAGSSEQAAGRSKKESESPATGYQQPTTRFYGEMGILAVTRAYLTTDVWLHVYAPEEGFDFYKVTETGISGSGFATYIGAGGDYYLKKWLSIGLDVHYNIGGIADLKFARYFTVDPLEEDIIKPGDRALYIDLIRGAVSPLFIDLEGWDLKGQVRVYF